MVNIFAFIALLSMLGVRENYAYNEVVKCIRDYQKIGCFKESTNLDLIISDRDLSGHELDWGKFDASLHSLACRCSMKAKALGYTFFAIRFWAECWAGKDIKQVENVLMKPQLKAEVCLSYAYKKCNHTDENECTSTAHHEYIYTIKFCKTANGGYTEWMPWSSCSGNCGKGIRTRERTCTNPMPSGRGNDCSKFGPTSKAEKCKPKCIVDGKWGDWGVHGVCNKPCGVGHQSRSRSCNNPAPGADGGSRCLTSDGARALKEVHKRNCNIQPCAVDGIWGDWGIFGECNKPCGGGRQFRNKLCNNPKPLHGGLKCLTSNGVRALKDVDVRACNIDACAVNGNWGYWGNYGECSKECGSGKWSRKRLCNNPSPAHGGLKCTRSDGSGERALTDTSEENCNDQPCAVHGNWGDWADFGSCNKKCGGGDHPRRRLCNNPSPNYGGLKCLISGGSGTRAGQDIGSRKCNTQACAVDGKWAAWGGFGACSKICGGGEQKRTRLCKKPAPSNGGLQCLKSGGNGARALTDTSVQKCNTLSCADCVKTSGGSAKGACCHFPFTYKKVTYKDCTKVAASKMWCATKSGDYSKHQKWGYCPETCKFEGKTIKKGSNRISKSCKKCTCKGYNDLSCISLCPTHNVNCKFGEKAMSYREKVSDTPTCTCNKKKCVGLRQLKLQKASMSSPYKLYPASYAIDRDTSNGKVVYGRCANSLGTGSTQWWMGELSGVATINSVKIYSRQDCCKDRYVDVKIYVGEGSKWKLCHDVGNALQTAKGWAEFECAANAHGRFITVVQPNNKELAVCEIEVYGYSLQAIAKLKLHNPTMRSPYTRYPASYAIDGRTSNGKVTYGRCANSNSGGTYQWWKGVLSGTATINSIRIYSRQDCCKDRYTDVQVWVGEASAGKTKWNLCKDLKNSLQKAKGWTEVKCPANTKGKVIRVTQGNKKEFSLCEIEVYGTIIIPNLYVPPATCPSAHPYAYFNGTQCCKYNREKTYAPQGKLCDGSRIGFTSKCCKDDKHTPCISAPCRSYVTDETVMLLKGRFGRKDAMEAEA